MKALFSITAVVILALWVVARLWVPLDKAPALFCLAEITDSRAFASRLQTADDPVALHLRERLSDTASRLLDDYDPATRPPEQLVKELVYSLNDILEGDPVYDEARFAGVPLAAETRSRLGKSARGVDLVFLNRMLIEDAFAESLAPMADKPEVTVLSWTTDPNPARHAQLAPFNALHCDLAVVVEPNSYDKVIIQCSSGVGPDIIEIYGNTMMVGYAEAGILMDLTPYAEEFGFSPDVTFPQLRGNIFHEGKQYRFPCNIGNQVLIYNKELFARAGVPEPTNDMDWYEFIERVRPLTVPRADGLGMEQFAMLLDRSFVKDIHLQFGARFYTDDLTASALDEPESIAAVQFYHDLIFKHRLLPSAIEASALAADGGWGTNEIRWFATGRAAVLWGARWMVVQFRMYPDLDGKLGAAYLPHVKGRQTACYTGTRGPGINANSENRMKALEFMKYLASDEYNRTIALGSDGLPPNYEFASNPDNLLNPRYPGETREFHKTFVDAMEYARSPDVSPFVDPVIVDRIWFEALDEVANNLKPADRAMRDAAKRINDRIAQNIKDRPDLKALYDRIKAESQAAAAAAASTPPNANAR